MVKKGGTIQQKQAQNVNILNCCPFNQNYFDKINQAAFLITKIIISEIIINYSI